MSCTYCDGRHHTLKSCYHREDGTEPDRADQIADALVGPRGPRGTVKDVRKRVATYLRRVHGDELPSVAVAVKEMG